MRLVAAVVCATMLVGPSGRAATPFRLAVEDATNGGAITLWRIDPASLAHLSRKITLGEYHRAWALSPARSHAAFGISASGRHGRIGVRVVDVRRWKVAANIETGIAAEALWWPRARRLVAVLQRGGAVVADPATRRIVRRIRLPGVPTVDAVYTSAVVRRGLVVLLGGGDALAAIDASGSVRTVALDRIPVTAADGSGLSTALVASDDRAVVLGAGIAAEIDLGTRRVSYHDIARLGAGVKVMVAVALGDAVAVSGRRNDLSAAGLDLLDTTTWRVRHVESAADSLTGAGGVVLAYRRGGKGVRAYRGDGTRAFTLLGDNAVSGVVATGTTAYITTADATYVVDAASGTIVRRIAPPRNLLDLIA